MLLKILSSVVLLSSFSVMALPSDYKLKLDMKIDGKKVSSKILSVEKDKPAQFEQELGKGKAHIVLNADEIVQDSARLAFEIYLEEKAGKKELISSPQMIVMLGKEASMTITNTGNKRKFNELSLKIYAEKNEE